MANRPVRTPARGPRRVPEWGGVLVRSRLLALSTSQSLGAVTIGAAFTQKATLVRIRGMANVQLDPSAIADTMIVGLGILIVRTTAFIAGAASMPSPLDDIESAFLYHKIFTLGPSLTAGEVGEELNSNLNVEIDSKAMRKVGPDDTLGIIWDGIQLAGTPTADCVCAIRNLVLLA